jgi:preprotein translocase subunit SecE
MPGRRRYSVSENPDRPEIERQGRVVLWMTIGAALLIVIIAALLALILTHTL